MLGLIYFTTLIGALWVCIREVARFLRVEGATSSQLVACVLASITVAITWKHILSFMVLEGEGNINNPQEYFFSNEFFVWLFSWDNKNNILKVDDQYDEGMFTENIFFVAYREVSRTWFGWWWSQNLLVSAVVLTAFVGILTTRTIPGRSAAVPGFSLLIVGYLGAMSLCLFLVLAFLLSAKNISGRSSVQHKKKARKAKDSSTSEEKNNTSVLHYFIMCVALACYCAAIASIHLFPQTVMDLSGAMPSNVNIAAMLTSAHFRPNLIFLHVILLVGFFITTVQPSIGSIVNMRGKGNQRMHNIGDFERKLVTFSYLVLAALGLFVHIHSGYVIFQISANDWVATDNSVLSISFWKHASHLLVNDFWLNDCQTSIAVDCVFMSLGTLLLVISETSMVHALIVGLSMPFCGTGCALACYLAYREKVGF
eukprot:CFRG5419T1